MPNDVLDPPKNGGPALDPDPQEPHEGDDGFKPGELLIDGDGQITWESKPVHGKQPTGATLAIGGKFNVLRNFDRGERLDLTLKDADGAVIFDGSLLIVEDGGVDKIDKETGQVTAAIRKHVGRITN